MSAHVRNFRWTDKQQIPKEVLLGVAASIFIGISFFKMKPYFQSASPQVVTYSAEKRIQGGKQEEFPRDALKSIPNKKTGTYAGARNNYLGPTAGSRERQGNSSANSIIERPLFDNLLVTLQGVLLQGVSSAESGSHAEVQLLMLLPDDNGYIPDIVFPQDAVLVGSAQPNFQSKRYHFKFTELISKDGRRYQISGYAYDLETRMAGVPADYSSGLASRLAGAALNRTIVSAEQAATLRILQNTTGNNPTSRELDRMAVETSTHSAQAIADETTRGLRETQAELNLPAGTPITVRIKATGQTGGGR